MTLDIKDPFYKGEKLYRAIKSVPQMWKIVKDKKIPTSAIFKDSQGVSVDRQDSRDNKVAVERLASTRDGEVVSVTVDNCEEINLNYETDPIMNNPYHCLIKGKEKTQLTSSEAKRLVKCAVFETSESTEGWEV